MGWGDTQRTAWGPGHCPCWGSWDNPAPTPAFRVSLPAAWPPRAACPGPRAGSPHSTAGPSILTVTPDPMGWIQDKSPSPARQVVRAIAPRCLSGCTGRESRVQEPTSLRSPHKVLGSQRVQGSPWPSSLSGQTVGGACAEQPPSPTGLLGEQFWAALPLWHPRVRASPRSRRRWPPRGRCECQPLPAAANEPDLSQRAAGRFVGTRNQSLR